MQTPTAILAEIIRAHGPIPTVRVSSAQARGRAKDYPYWGAVRYEIGLTRDGRVSNRPMGRASSDRRSWDLAHWDALDMGAAEGRIVVQTIGTLSDAEAERVIARVARS